MTVGRTGAINRLQGTDDGEPVVADRIRFAIWFGAKGAPMMNPKKFRNRLGPLGRNPLSYRTVCVPDAGLVTMTTGEHGTNRVNRPGRHACV